MGRKSCLYGIAVKLCVPLVSSAVPPPLDTTPPDQPLCPNQVSHSEQCCHVNVQRAIRLGICEQLVYGGQSRRNGIRACPRRLEEIQTYLACLVSPEHPSAHFSALQRRRVAHLEMNIWMTYRRYKDDLGRCQRIVVWYSDVELPNAIYGTKEIESQLSNPSKEPPTA